MNEVEIAKDYRLVGDFLQGDRGAWDTLYNQSSGIVQGFARGYTRCFKTGDLTWEDVAAEAYCRAFRRMAYFEGRSRFSTWVCAIVKRVVWSEHAKTCRRERIYRQRLTPDATLYSRDPCDIVLESNLYSSLWRALDCLPPVDSYILEGRVVEEQSFRKLSQSTQLPCRVVRLRYREALQKYAKRFHSLHHRTV